MKALIFICLFQFTSILIAQDYYEKARASFGDNELDSARYYIDLNLSRKPTTPDYFLSGMIHEAENKPLRALADYEAVMLADPSNLEACFQKGMIYYEEGSVEQAIKDFTYVIDRHKDSETKAVYYGSDPLDSQGSFITTLQSMLGRVYQYRGLAFQKSGELNRALLDFNKAFEYDTLSDFFINRSQLYARMGQEDLAVIDLRKSIELDSNSYLAWYNLAILDQSARLPSELMNDLTFVPMLNLMGANAHESGDFNQSIQYYSRALTVNRFDDLALIGRGKALMRLGEYPRARRDFIEALQTNPKRIEALHLIGNSFFYEKNYSEAIGFYDQYLSVDRSYSNVWFNGAMAHLSLKNQETACLYLKEARSLGMEEAISMLARHCGNQ